MKNLLLTILCLSALYASAQKLAPPDAKALVAYNSTMAQLKPAYKNYITQTAGALKNRTLNLDSLKRTIKKNNAAAGLTGGDIDELAQQIMVAANVTVYNDIKNMMNEMEKTRQKKEALRKEEDALNNWFRRAGDSNKIKAPSYTEKTKRLAKIKKEKDAMSEMEKDDMFFLQQRMEEKNRLETMISNMMKAEQEQPSKVSGNLKAS